MGENAYRFFVVEGGGILEKCNALRSEYNEVHKVLAAFASKYGARSYYMTGGGFATGRERPKLFGLTVVRPLPVGWKLDRRRDYMTPYAKEKELQAEIKALPSLPNLRGDISKAIGWETHYESTAEPGRTYGRPTCQLIWSGDTFCICAPMHSDLGGMTPDLVRAAMAHPVPTGCRETTQAEWELISATEQVKAEKAA